MKKEKSRASWFLGDPTPLVDFLASTLIGIAAGDCSERVDELSDTCGACPVCVARKAVDRINELEIDADFQRGEEGS